MIDSCVLIISRSMAIITRSYTKTYLSNVNINSELKLNVLNRACLRTSSHQYPSNSSTVFGKVGYYEHSFVFVWLSYLKQSAHNTLSKTAHISHSDVHAAKRQYFEL